jgi:hypothetical protein
MAFLVIVRQILDHEMMRRSSTQQSIRQLAWEAALLLTYKKRASNFRRFCHPNKSVNLRSINDRALSSGGRGFIHHGNLSANPVTREAFARVDARLGRRSSIGRFDLRVSAGH